MSSRTTSRVLCAAVLALATTLTGTASASTAPRVATTEGLVRGVATETHDQFLGIPYAAPPVGELRWQPPRPAARWAGARDASRFSSPCAQPAGPFGTASLVEDCLYLNV